jgi:hypothetical protein
MLTLSVHVEIANGHNFARPATLPRENYLNSRYGLKSWLLTQDRKRIALLYLFSSLPVFDEQVGLSWAYCSSLIHCANRPVSGSEPPQNQRGPSSGNANVYRVRA